jgi:transposase
MIEPDKRKAIYLLHKEGLGIRALARQLGVSRKAIRSIIALKGEMPDCTRESKVKIDPEVLRELHAKCEGRKQRVMEELADDKKIEVKYSTLTRLMRKLGIGAPQDMRCDHVPDVPGAEMQHDTSPYEVKLNGVPTTVIASMLYLRYSKRRYLKFYRSFNRFAMKCFLHEALIYWAHAAPECIIDNTNLARWYGTGKDAVMIPEMAAFALQYGFKFVCHEKGHANRKAGEERSFWTVQTNFFPGRTFRDMEDLNRQAFEWATERMYHRPLAKTHIIPAKAFEHEQPYLKKVLPHLPAPYLVLERCTDQYGYASVEGNFYWVPGTSREDVKVLRYAERVEIYRRRERLVVYALPADGVKNARISPEGFPKPRYEPRGRRRRTDEEEKRLRAMGATVNAYLDFVLKPAGIQRHRFLRELFAMTRRMSGELFVKAVERALKYRITTLDTIERIALLYVAGSADALPAAEVDENFRARDTYEEGRLTDAPDFTAYKDL